MAEYRNPHGNDMLFVDPTTKLEIGVWPKSSLRDHASVVQIDTGQFEGQRLRVNLNDAPIWDGDPQTDERPGSKLEVDWPLVHVPETVAAAVWSYFEGGHRCSRFEVTLIHAFLAADNENRERLGFVFPAYGRAIGLWQSAKEELRALAGVI